MEDAAPRVGAFSHGYTYSGHPVSAAAANAVLDIVEKENLAAAAAETGAYMLRRFEEEFCSTAYRGRGTWCWDACCH